MRFRRVTRGDFRLLSSWLAEPHVARWWNHEYSPEAVARDFGPSADGTEPSEDWLVMIDEEPVGLVQVSFFGDYPEYIAEMAAVFPVNPMAMTIDYLIGPPELVGRGLGRRMIAAFVATLWKEHEAATSVVVPVNALNVASWRALEGAGFARVAEGDLEPDHPDDPHLHYIYELRRPRPQSDRA